MSLPKDPFMLLSYINTQLRDNFSSLSELAASTGADEEEIKNTLGKAGFVYDSGLNRFTAAQ
jgi:hypothetical protein